MAFIYLFVCFFLRMQKLSFSFQYWLSDTVHFCLLQLVFMVFTGESWGFLGSRRFLLELDLHSDAVNGLDFSLIDMVFTTFWSIFYDFVLFKLVPLYFQLLIWDLCGLANWLFYLVALLIFLRNQNV